VRNRRALLRQMLDALAAQTLADHEVIIVDDGSDDGADDEARQAAERGEPVKVVPNAGVGAYAGRRTGIEMSSAPYVAFTDSDCVPEPGWLAAGVAALEAGADVVNGMTIPARNPGPLERTMISGEEGLYPTCNVFYRRAAYDAAGGFDESAADRFGFASGTPQRAMGFGEDTLLGWRVRRAGTAGYAPDAVVRHHVFGFDAADTVRRTRMMVAFPALFREVPELRAGPLTRHGILLNTPNRMPVYAVAAALATGRRRLALAGLGWWVALRVRDVRGQAGTPARRLATVPIQLALDALTTGELIMGSLRARTLVL
jgi:glycosyltransferase involved in cell wall biosynthesis